MKHELPESLLITVKGLHQAITSEAHVKIETLEAEHQDAIKELRLELEALQQQHNQTLQANIQIEKDKAQITEEKLALQHYIDAQKQVNSQKAQKLHLLTECLNDKKSDIENLHQQLQHAQTNLEHYREATRQEREQERLSFNEKLTQLEQSLKEANHQVISSQMEVSHLQKNQEQTKSDLQVHIQAREQAQSQVNHLELNLQQHTSDNNQLQKEFDEIKQKQHSLLAQSITSLSLAFLNSGESITEGHALTYHLI